MFITFINSSLAVMLFHIYFNTLKDKMTATLQTVFSRAIYWMESLCLLKMVLKYVCKGPFNNDISIGSDNGLAENMLQTIILSNNRLIYRGIFAMLSLDEFLYRGMMMLVTADDQLQVTGDDPGLFVLGGISWPLLQIMACSLCGAKPLYETMLPYSDAVYAEHFDKELW